jgi:probable selenium-dependent hydroxylase accessory protein YqeC
MGRDQGTIRIREHLSLCEALGIGDHEVIALTGAGPMGDLLEDLSRELADLGRVLVTTTTQIDAPSEASGCPLVLAENYDDAEHSVGDALARGRRVTLARDPLADGRLRGLPRRWVDRLVDAGVADHYVIAADSARGEALKVPGLDEPVIPGRTTLLLAAAGADALDKPLTEGVVHRPEVLAAKLGLQFRQRIEAKHIAQALVGEGCCSTGAPEGARVLPLLCNSAAIPDVKVRTIVYALFQAGVDRVIAHPGPGIAQPVRSYD